MKIFLSWSGERSRLVAEAAKQWLLDTLHVARPWISTHDIQRGALWLTTINEQLKDTGIGIVFLTKENLNKPWILFEAGALAKGLSTNRVCTFLIDLDAAQVDDPLAQFNHTFLSEGSTLDLLRTINTALGEQGRDDASLRRSHEKFFPDFEGAIVSAIDSTEPPAAPAPQTQGDMLAELVNLNKSMLNRLARLENAQMAEDNHRKALADALLSRGTTPAEVAAHYGISSLHRSKSGAAKMQGRRILRAGALDDPSETPTQG